MEAVCAAQVLHTRSCTGLGMQFVRFLTACYLTFNMDSSTVTAALAALPPLVSERRVSSYAGSAPRVVLGKYVCCAVELVWQMGTVMTCCGVSVVSLSHVAQPWAFSSTARTEHRTEKCRV